MGDKPLIQVSLYFPNPNDARFFFRGNPTKSPYICYLCDSPPSHGSHLMTLKSSTSHHLIPAFGGGQVQGFGAALGARRCALAGLHLWRWLVFFRGCHSMPVTTQDDPYLDIAPTIFPRIIGWIYHPGGNPIKPTNLHLDIAPQPGLGLDYLIFLGSGISIFTCILPLLYTWVGRSM